MKIKQRYKNKLKFIIKPYVEIEKYSEFKNIYFNMSGFGIKRFVYIAYYWFDTSQIVWNRDVYEKSTDNQKMMLLKILGKNFWLKLIEKDQ